MKSRSLLFAVAFSSLVAACGSAPAAPPAAPPVNLDQAPPPPPPAGAPTDALASPPAPTTSAAAPASPSWDLNITIDKSGARTINGKAAATDDDLLRAAREVASKAPGARAMIQADATTSQAVVIHVIDLLKQAGVTKIALGVTR